MIYVLPKLYDDGTGHLFVRCDNRHATMAYWQRVKRVIPGFYIGVGQRMRDFVTMFERVQP